MTASSLRHRIRADFSRAAPQYDAYAELQHQVLTIAAGKIAPSLRPGSLWLDAGCGTGAWHMIYSTHPGECGVVQLDLAEGMCRAARKNGSFTLCADMAAIPFPDTVFGGVFSSMALQWAAQPMQVLKEWHRVTQPGGRAMVALPLEGTLRELETLCREMFDASPLWPMPRQTELAEWIGASGWHILENQRQEIVISYPDLAALRQTLKAIGAQHKEQGIAWTPSHWREAQQRYTARFALSKGVRATYQIAFLMLEKPQ